MTTVPMKWIQIVVLKEDLVPVLRYLGSQGCLQLSHGAVAGTPEDELRTSLQKTAEVLGLGRTPVPRSSPVPFPVDRARALVGRVADFAARKDDWSRRSESCSRRTERLAVFRGLGLTWRDWAGLKNLGLEVGTFSEADVPTSELGGSAVLRPLETPGIWAAAGLSEFRPSWGLVLEKHGFRPFPRPTLEEWGAGDQTPDQRLEALDAEAEILRAENERLEETRVRLVSENGGELLALLGTLRVEQRVRETAASLESSKNLGNVEGWLPSETVAKVVAELGTLTGDLVAVSVRDPGPDDRVPTRLRRRWGTAGFERMVANFGAPLYGTIDPTPPMAWTYVLFFSLMFGDVGQGFCLFLIGVFLGRGIPGFLGFRPSAAAFRKVGLGAMAAGVLYGSVFSVDSLLIPLTRTVTGWFGGPADHLLALVPVNDPAKLAAFFGFTLLLGVVVNSLGLGINLFNNLKLRRWEEAFVAKTGLAGALFFWYGLFFGIRILLGGRPEPWDLAGFLVPLGVLTLGPPAFRWAAGERVAEEGPGLFVLSVFIEIFETVSYYLSNTLSFLRIGAFALSHAVLSLITVTLATLVARSVAGLPGGVLVFLTGNAIILFLEGLIVSIQVLRLQYYEFFSKFFFETGTWFRPFQFSDLGEEK
jgi:V/A-type H+-transporting ATPase subunit I